MSDDLGYEVINANGGTSYKTPVLNELAKTGIRFENAHAQPRKQLTFWLFELYWNSLSPGIPFAL